MIAKGGNHFKNYLKDIDDPEDLSEPIMDVLAPMPGKKEKVKEIDFDIENHSMTVFFYRTNDDDSNTWYINYFSDFFPFNDRAYS